MERDDNWQNMKRAKLICRPGRADAEWPQAREELVQLIAETEPAADPEDEDQKARKAKRGRDRMERGGLNRDDPPEAA